MSRWCCSRPDFLLAGTVLPLATVYSWGRVFPRWLPLMAGRGVPRWLVLGPGLALGVGMTAYFGVTLFKTTADTLTGTWQSSAGSEPLWFFWIAVPAYFVWGLGMGVAALAYGRATRPPAASAADGREGLVTMRGSPAGASRSICPGERAYDPFDVAECDSAQFLLRTRRIRSCQAQLSQRGEGRDAAM